MRKTKLFIFSVLSFTLISCGVPRDLIDKQSVKIDAQNVSMLNGSYGNMEDSSTCVYRECTLWDELQPFYSLHNFNDYKAEPDYNWKREHVNIEIANKKIIRFSLYSDQKKIRSKRFRYKIKDGYLIIKRFSFKGVPPVLYWYKYQELYFSIDLENNLVMDLQGESAGGIFIFIAGSSNQVHTVFKKI